LMGSEDKRALDRMSVAERQRRRAAKFGTLDGANKGEKSAGDQDEDDVRDVEGADSGPGVVKEPEKKKFKVRIGQRDDLEKH
jgi:hypothetical protein